ncbi:MAG: cell division protein FtsZ [Cloacibacterium sp.]|nr:cell division protein FtsZ [Cloacibacterium sp.]
MENTVNTGFSFDLPKGNSSIIKVIGVGGGGNNALKHMYEKGIKGVDFIICNTDSQTLDNNPISNKVQLGVTITEGLGAGADPQVGEKAAMESIDEIKSILGSQTKMVFITAGMGGGTGTGAAPVIAKVAKDMGILTVGIVTVPFSFEGKRRLDQAESGLEKLRDNVDSLIVINNDKLRQQFGNLGFKAGFSKADEVLANAAKGMAEVITGYFDVNIDFRDAKSVLQNSGTALMSEGIASGENKAEEAVKKALDSPLLNDNKITGAKNVLLLIRSGVEEATMDEIGLINDHIQKEAGNTADIIFGVGSDEELGDAISVLVIATGFSLDDQKYSGPTETIRYSLDEKPEVKKEKTPQTFSFSSEENAEKPSFTPEKQEKSLFRLEDDEDFPTPDFTSNTLSQGVQTQNVLEETVAEIKFFDGEESNNIQSNTIIEEEQEEPVVYREPDLFSYDEEILEAQSFSFEVEEPLETEKTLFFTEEKPVDFSFVTKEEIVTEQHKQPEPVVEIQAPKAETNLVVEEEKEEAITEIHFEIEQQEEFTIVEKKKEEDPKIQERRNKLKEFNSRYQVAEDHNEFETIPAFRRKNMNIEMNVPSEQKITGFFSEQNGRMQLRENKFLNKDVD